MAGAALSDRPRPFRVDGIRWISAGQRPVRRGTDPAGCADDTIWVHDYHLLCLADALRARGLTNRIGLFLHTPFPPPGVFMTIPSHAALIQAMCAYDLLGFQTEIDRTAFIDYALRHAGGTLTEADGVVAVFGRLVRTGSIPSASMSMRSAHRRRPLSTDVKPRGCGPT